MTLHPAWPMWALVLASLIAASLVVYHYASQRKIASPSLIHLLTAIRLCLILLVLAILLAPVHITSHQTHSRGTLWLIVDNSASMRQIDRQMPEVERGQWSAALGGMTTNKVATQTRSQLAAAMLRRLNDLAEQYDVKIIPVSQPHVIAVEKNHVSEAAAELLQDPVGRTTAIGEALRLVHAEANDPATVLIVSDGRQNTGADAIDQARRLSEQGGRVFALSVGSHRPVRDAAVESIDAPDWVFPGDQLTLSTSIRLDGIDASEPVKVQLRRDGRVVQEKTIVATQPRASFQFIEKPEHGGVFEYQIAIEPIVGEATTTNNCKAVRVPVNRKRLKVLLVDGQPRWEYQFLRNYLKHDRRFELHAVLLEPARTESIPQPVGAVLPATPQEWSAFDVVIFGDVPPERLSIQQQTNLVTALQDGKLKSLVLIAGPQNMPGRFVSSPLAETIPVQLSENDWDSDHLRTDLHLGFVPRRATDSRLTQFSADYDENAQWWSSLPAWFWHATQTTARPGATVAWSIPDSPESRGATKAPPNHGALVATMQYGTGRVLYLASPETWRLRYVQRADRRVEDLHRRFWGQVMRWISAESQGESLAAQFDLEDRNLSADPECLAAIAKAGNGKAFDGPDFARLATELPRTDCVATVVQRIGLFGDPPNRFTRMAHWAAFFVFLVLITGEWVLRKRAGMV